MAILGDEDAQIEVRLRKLPVGNTAIHPSYLTEYAQTDKPDNIPQKVNRYIVPDGGAYGIEIMLKKGFVQGKYDGLAVILHDKKTQKVFHERTLISSLVKSGKSRYDHDKKFSILCIPQSSVDGNEVGESRVTFYRLCPDKNSFEKTIDPGYKNKLVASLEVELIRYTKPSQGQKSAVDPKEAEFQEKMKSYKRLASVLRNNVLAQDKSADAAAAPRDHHDRVNYAPTTQATKMIGATEAGTLLKPPERWYTCEHETRRFNFLSRSQGFIDAGKFIDKSVPEECLPWDKLRDDAHRKNCFKILQAYDKEMTLAQRETEAGAVTLAEKNMIYKDLFNSGELPNKWRPWDNLYAREREPLFVLLQDRRKYFDRGEYPPEPEASPSKARSLQSRPLNAPSTPTASPTSSKRASEPANRRPSDKLSKSAAAVTLSDRFLSPNPPRAPTSLNLKSPLPSSLPAPVSTPARVATSKKMASGVAIPKPAEPDTIAIDLDSYPTSSPASVKRTPIRSGADGNTPSKRVKLEINDPAVPQSMEDAEEELRKMEEEDERDAEELRQRQRIADLLQARRERDARKAALLAKANYPTSPSS